MRRALVLVAALSATLSLSAQWIPFYSDGDELYDIPAQVLWEYQCGGGDEVCVYGGTGHVSVTSGTAPFDWYYDPADGTRWNHVVIGFYDNGKFVKRGRGKVHIIGDEGHTAFLYDDEKEVFRWLGVAGHSVRIIVQRYMQTSLDVTVPHVPKVDKDGRIINSSI